MGGKEDILKNRKIRAILELLLFHFRVVTFSISSHASSRVCQLPSFPRFYSTLLCAAILQSAFYGTKIGTSKNMIMAVPDPNSVERIHKNIRENLVKISNISRKISWKIREFCLEKAVTTLILPVFLFLLLSILSVEIPQFFSSCQLFSVA